jgi:hypothetical protein
MIRNTIRAATAALAALAIPAAIFTAPPAGASTAFHMCETYGSYCVGSADLNLYTAVSERNPGRLIIPVSLGGEFDNYGTWLLEFNNDPSECVAAANNLSDVVIHPCNGGSGVVWARDNSSGNDKWINQEASEGLGIWYLSGSDQGRDYFLDLLGVTGTYQAFHFE